jgi:hypothetical protein
MSADVRNGWGVQVFSGRIPVCLLQLSWLTTWPVIANALPDSPNRAMIFTTRKKARAMAVVLFVSSAAGWSYRAVKVRETIEVIA